MRRNNRKKLNSTDNLNTILYITGGIFILALIAFGITFVTYSGKNSIEDLDTEYLAQFENNKVENTTSASTSIGKNVEEAKNELNKENENTVKIYKSNINENNSKNSQTQIKKTTESKSNKSELRFEKPIDGEIIKEFTSDNLVYSETLKEWITHFGIDIKAERATEVKAAEKGKVKSIKNDPRYGLTIIIEHEDGYKTLYSNLLTTEFVSEGEEVSKGQIIASIGDSAIYEIVDESHLHFEIIKNGENLNPQDIIKY